MAGLTKEQREAKRLAAEAAQQNTEKQDLIAMIAAYQAFPGAPTEAEVHPDEVENWKAHGWSVKG
ncbi:hypothetical protein BFS14_01790 [Serratia fonticola]|uniref:hypothetical protein n=1 Tax=Serratia fonticola TaxID=47917 RepID=UPI0008FD5B2D|nr:hypothetical protein [Serratia fonticola]OIX96221.1 hypothetical protein BFS14_01790 [Serratia fonticola]QCR60858.1 hypothetical protein FD644_10985 [Serratia fonticola]